MCANLLVLCIWNGTIRCEIGHAFEHMFFWHTSGTFLPQTLGQHDCASGLVHPPSDHACASCADTEFKNPFNKVSASHTVSHGSTHGSILASDTCCPHPFQHLSFRAKRCTHIQAAHRLRLQSSFTGATGLRLAAVLCTTQLRHECFAMPISVPCSATSGWLTTAGAAARARAAAPTAAAAAAAGAHQPYRQPSAVTQKELAMSKAGRESIVL